MPEVKIPAFWGLSIVTLLRIGIRSCVRRWSTSLVWFHLFKPAVPISRFRSVLVPNGTLRLMPWRKTLCWTCGVVNGFHRLSSLSLPKLLTSSLSISGALSPNLKLFSSPPAGEGFSLNRAHWTPKNPTLTSRSCGCRKPTKPSSWGCNSAQPVFWVLPVSVLALVSGRSLLMPLNLPRPWNQAVSSLPPGLESLMNWVHCLLVVIASRLGNFAPSGGGRPGLCIHAVLWTEP